MKRVKRSTHRLYRIVDMIASRLGICAVIAVLFATFISAGLHVNTVVLQLENNHTIFRDRHPRNGYVAISDIQELLLVAQRAVNMGEMTPELAQNFSHATATLDARTKDFYSDMTENNKMSSGMAVVESLMRVLDIANHAINEGFTNDHALVNALLHASDDARRNLVFFLDDIRGQAENLLDTQSQAVRKQRLIVIANMVGLIFVGTGALLLLRREVLGRRARDIVENCVEFLAFFDQLTTLPNRAQFQDRLETLLNAPAPLALIFVDLDNFKSINDTYGHATGDAALRHIGGILASVAQANDGFAARLGGDEFALVIPQDDTIRLQHLCQGLLADTAAPFNNDGEAFEIGLSIGLATTTQVAQYATVSLDMLSRVTDFALYTSKAAGRRQYTFYDHVLETRFQERRALLEELPQAIQNGDLEVHLQPKVDLTYRAVFGFEALVRWRRNGQLVAPDDFILIAEENGLVVDIDHYVLRQATKIMADWNAQYDTNFSVSVNLSALHFNSLRVIEWVQDALWMSRLRPGLLTLEITETIEMQDWSQADAVITGLKQIGSRIAIDDFGTGFSSLAQLGNTQADELKIDRSLVEELETSENAYLLLTSVLDIARNLELDVTIEGIETEAQAKIIHRMGAISGQGYLFGRPQQPEVALSSAMTTIGRGTQITHRVRAS